MKYLRLKKQKDILKILKTGTRSYAQTLCIVFAPSKEVEMAVCVGKKYGKSVQRNRVKRLLRAAFCEYADKLISPVSVLLLPKQAEDYRFSLFVRDIGKILKKEHLIEG